MVAFTKSRSGGLTRGKIEDLQRIEAVLRQMAAQCDRGAVPECPVLDSLFDGGGIDEISGSASGKIPTRPVIA